MTLALSGATGRLGRLVLDQLVDLSPVLVVRDPARAPALGLEVRQAAYRDYDACRRALDGVDTVFMVSAHESRRRREGHRRFVMAAEDAIRASGMSWTFLRDNFYLDDLPHFADAEGVIRGPAGEGRVAAVARADIADVAAVVLREPAAHSEATYSLTGPEALTFAELAARGGAALGRELRFEDETVEHAYASRRAAYDVEEWQLDAWVSTYTAIADGSVATVTDDVRHVTGHAPRSLEQALAHEAFPETHGRTILGE